MFFFRFYKIDYVCICMSYFVVEWNFSILYELYMDKCVMKVVVIVEKIIYII